MHKTKIMNIELALKINKLIHDECKDAPHDIGLKVIQLIEAETEAKNISSNLLIMPSLLAFKELRIKRGLTLREVETATGISNAYLSQLENGKIKKPSFEVVQKLNNLYANNGA